MVITVGCFILLLLLVSVAPSMSYGRSQKLANIIKDLRELRTTADSKCLYAIDENIAFFEAIRTLPGYIMWGLSRRRRVDGERLMEIADLNLPQWEKELYEDLSYVERKKFPGLSKPLRDILSRLIKKERKNVLILDLGCGGMEVERQVFMDLQSTKSDCHVAFVGVDAAPQSWDAIKKTFSATGIPLRRVEGMQDIEALRSEHMTVFFLCADALQIAEHYGGRFDLVFSSRFRHHLNAAGKQRLDDLSKKLGNVVEYDDYGSGFSWLPPVLTAWYRPILLNGAVLSQLRQPTKRELLRQRRDEADRIHIRFFSPPGSYARAYSRNDGITL